MNATNHKDAAAELPALPNPNDYCEGKDSLYEESQQCLAYERARADAWEARCRLAVEALNYAFEQHNYPQQFSPLHNHWAAKAMNTINAIGPLPPLPEKARETK